MSLAFQAFTVSLQDVKGKTPGPPISLPCAASASETALSLGEVSGRDPPELRVPIALPRALFAGPRVLDIGGLDEGFASDLKYPRSCSECIKSLGVPSGWLCKDQMSPTARFSNRVQEEEAQGT